MTTNRQAPSREEVLGYLKDDTNWGRWGPDDQKGAVNMVDDAKRLRAASLVKTGRAVSLSREFPVTPAPNNPTPAIHYMRKATLCPGSGRAEETN